MIFNMMQETLLNLLLRNYLHYNLYDQAEKLRSKAPRFEAHSNQQVSLIDYLAMLCTLRGKMHVNIDLFNISWKAEVCSLLML